MFEAEQILHAADARLPFHPQSRIIGSQNTLRLIASHSYGSSIHLAGRWVARYGDMSQGFSVLSFRFDPAGAGCQRFPNSGVPASISITEFCCQTTSPHPRIRRSCASREHRGSVQGTRQSHVGIWGVRWIPKPLIALPAVRGYVAT